MDRLIVRIVYRLCELTGEEIEVLERRVWITETRKDGEHGGGVSVSP